MFFLQNGQTVLKSVQNIAKITKILEHYLSWKRNIEKRERLLDHPNIINRTAQSPAASSDPVHAK